MPAARTNTSKLHPLLAQVFRARGAAEPTQLDYALRNLLPPDGLLNITAAAEVIGSAVVAGRAILVVGDFDADGATSSVLMLRALRAMGAAQVDFLVPNRFEFGYGLTPEIVAVAASRDPALIITVDNGIASVDGVACARDLGIDVVVTDHHLAPADLPAAAAIVNPNQPGDEFASKSLAGVGVAFYVLAEVRRWLRQRDWFTAEPPALAPLLDLVALGTIADVVPLDYNNRVLVSQGLRRIRAGNCCPGISALLALAGCRTQPVTTVDLAFGVAPRLNAAGRLADMSVGIECLLTDDPLRANELAAELHAMNTERRQIEAQMLADSEAALGDQAVAADEELPMAMCFYRHDWHPGVIGILASRLREQTGRPVIVFADDNEPGLIKGSARSMPGVHVRDAIERVTLYAPDLVLKFGGHAAAAGLTIPRDRLAEFETLLVRALHEMLDGVLPQDSQVSDGRIAPRELGLPLAELLRDAGIWGQGFPEPAFDGEFEVVSARIVADAHLKLVLKPVGGERLIDAIAFRETTLPALGSHVQLQYRLDVNEYDGIRRAQLNVQELIVV